MILRLFKYHWALLAMILLVFESIIKNLTGTWEQTVQPWNLFVQFEYKYYDSTICSLLLICASALLILNGLVRYKRITSNISTPIIFLCFISFLIGLLFSVEGILYHPEFSDNLSFASFIRYALHPMFLLYIFIIVVGFNHDEMNILKKYTLFLGLLFLFLSVYSLWQMSSTFFFITGRNPILVFMQNAFWSFLFYSVMNYKELSLKKYLVLVISFLFCAYISALLVSRSWIIQSLLAILILSYYYINNSNKRILFIILATVLILVAIPYFVISFTEHSSYELFLNKIDQDTRSSQYVLVFQQIPLTTFIFGGGMFYSWLNEYNELYRYIDNQTILFCYRYGIIPVMTYYVIILYPAIKLFFINKKRKYHPCYWYVFVWCLAINGLSVYNSLNWDYINMLLFIMSGHCWSILKNENSYSLSR